jgi:hypothetical protein
LTPVPHTGDPDDPHDRTAGRTCAPALTSLLHAADRIFVQTDVERDAMLGCASHRKRSSCKGWAWSRRSVTAVTATEHGLDGASAAARS